MVCLHATAWGQTDSLDYTPMGSGYTPSAITTTVEYDATTGTYVKVTKLGDMVLSREYMTFDEYQDWKMDDFIETSVERYRRELAGKRVLLALSGGVDSSVAAVLLHRAIGENLVCVFVDHGLMRKGEGDYIENVIGKKLGVNIVRIDAEERFLSRLAGVTDPERKRHIIGVQ